MVSRAGSTRNALRQRDRKLDAELDEALTQTFPASDPVAVGHVTGTEPPSRPIDTKAPLPSRRSRRSSRRRLG